MENMVVTPWSCYESWRPCQKTWPLCRHNGMILTMFHYIPIIIIARSWHGSHILRTWVDFQIRLTIEKSCCGRPQSSAKEFHFLLLQWTLVFNGAFKLSKGARLLKWLVFLTFFFHRFFDRYEMISCNPRKITSLKKAKLPNDKGN